MSSNAQDVCDIIDTSLTHPQIEAMLLTSENLIATHIDPLADSRVTLVVRDTIKVWLAAHFISVADKRVKEESADGIRTVFEGKTEMGLDATIYGQQAKMIDPTGMLSKIGRTDRKRLNYHFSTPRSEATDP